MLRLLALDFDGVISNSAPEAFVVALRTYVAMKAKTAFRDPSARVSGEAAPALDVVRGHELYRPFLDLMPLGNRAEDYAVILAAVEAGRELSDQAAYDAFREGIDLRVAARLSQAFLPGEGPACRRRTRKDGCG